VDEGFGGGDGITTADFYGNYDDTWGMALQPDGKVLLAGKSFGWISFPTQSTNEVSLARFQADGSLDPSFGVGGKVTTDFWSGDEYGLALAVQADGKIVLAGSISGKGGLARYHADGTLDTTFGTGGIVTTALESSTGVAYWAVAIDPASGKIFTAGYAIHGSEDFALARYNSDGTLDTNFGNAGFVLTEFNGTSVAHRLELLDGGKLLLGGYAYGGVSNYDFALARYSFDGSIDTSFGSGGKTTTDFAGFSDIGYGMAIGDDGKIVLSGFTTNATGAASVAVARYNSEGILDTTFNLSGKVTTSFGMPSESFAVDVDSDGRIIAGGHRVPVVSVPQTSEWALVRYNVNGSLDTTFSDDGIVTTHFGSNYLPRVRNLIVQPDGQILAGGPCLGPGGHDFAVVRYDGVARPKVRDVVDVSPDPRFTAVSSIEVILSEPIDLASFDHNDLTLTRDGGANIVNGDVTVALVSGTTYRINGLATLTELAGTYTLTVHAAGLTNTDGNAGNGSRADTWIMRTETPPTTSGIADVTAPEDAPDTTVSLRDSFDDVQDGSAGLVYTIVGNTNPGLFASATISGATDVLTLDYADDAHGSTSITIRATDNGGLFVEDTFSVTVLSVQEQADLLVAMIADLNDDGVLNNGQANSLIANLGSTDSPAADNKIEAFINHVNAFVHVGILTHQQGDILIGAAEDILIGLV
jgi:uncharacterized delta-60 repeat protein